MKEKGGSKRKEEEETQTIHPWNHSAVGSTRDRK